jgi:hypothetical protein
MTPQAWSPNRPESQAQPIGNRFLSSNNIEAVLAAVSKTREGIPERDQKAQISPRNTSKYGRLREAWDPSP